MNSDNTEKGRDELLEEFTAEALAAGSAMRVEDLFAHNPVVHENHDLQGPDHTGGHSSIDAGDFNLARMEHHHEDARRQLEEVAARRAIEGRDAEVLGHGLAFLSQALRFDDPEIAFYVGQLLIAHGEHLVQSSPLPAIDLRGIDPERLALLRKNPDASVRDAKGRFWKAAQKSEDNL